MKTKLGWNLSVPQGLVLGPLLFILKINICGVSGLLKTIIFADDATLFCCGDHLEEFMDAVRPELTKCKRLIDLNKFTLHFYDFYD